MGIFSNHKTVVAIFDSDQELEQATQLLHQRGLVSDDADQFTIIDHSSVSEEPPLAVPVAPVNAGGSNMGGVPVIQDPDGSQNRRERQRNTRNLLTDKGLDDEEADYYAMQVGRGSKILVLKADKDHVSEVVDLLEPASSKVTVA